MVPRSPNGLLRLPPKNNAKFASIEIAPAKVAVMVMISVSRFFTWESSWAMTPATSRSFIICRSPVVAATAALFGPRPVAKALGWGFSITYTRGIGSPSPSASRATIR